MWITTTRCACTAPSASSLRPICWPGGRRRSTPRAIASWRRRAGSGSYVGNRRREMVTMTVPGETEAGNAGMHPCRGIAWWAHRDDDRSAEALPRSSKNQIGSVDPDALKIPARRAEFTLTENARVPFHAEPGHDVDSIMPFHLKQNRSFAQNQRFSQIRYGSQVDLVIPLAERFEFIPVQQPGVHVEAGIDPLVRIHHRSSTEAP